MFVSVLVPAISAGDEGLTAAETVEALARTAWTVGAQTHAAWELLVAAPERSVGALAARLDALGLPSPWRLTLLPRPADDDLAVSLRAASEAAAGSWLTVLDPGDEYVPHTLEALLAATGPRTDLVYGDEVDPQDAEGAYRKPQWSPSFLLGHPYLGHPVLMRSEAVAAAGGFDPASGVAAEWDLLLRLSALAREVNSVPRLLAQTRVRSADRWTAAARCAARAAVERHLERLAVPAAVTALDDPWQLRVAPQVRDMPSVSVVIPTAGQQRELRGEQTELVVNALRSIARHTAGVDWRPVVVLGEGEPAGLRDRIIEAAGRPVTFVLRPGRFNFAGAVNEGVLAADGEFVLLLNDDTQVEDDAWLPELLGWAQQPGVGAVGPKLLFEDGSIQHVGVCLGPDGLPTHMYLRAPDEGDHRGALTTAAERLAVTGACLLVRRAAYLAAGGFCLDFPLNFNDVDFCLKLRDLGLRSVVVPHVRLTHFESSTRTPKLTETEVALYRELWGHLERDPFFDVQDRHD